MEGAFLTDLPKVEKNDENFTKTNIQKVIISSLRSFPFYFYPGKFLKRSNMVLSKKLILIYQ